MKFWNIFRFLNFFLNFWFFYIWIVPFQKREPWCDKEINDHCFAEGLDVKEGNQWPFQRRGPWCDKEINDHCFAEGLDVKESMTSPTERVSMQLDLTIPKEWVYIWKDSMTITKLRVSIRQMIWQFARLLIRTVTLIP